ncbi:MAG TPA: hypothetical protein VEY12_01860, partial [Thermoplasmata archaeon]|nr:hypothetical protein [Thermoplasmata archaeon]
MVFVPGFGRLWLDSIVVGTIFLMVAIVNLALALNPAFIASEMPLASTITAGFGASGISLLIFGS